MNNHKKTGPELKKKRAARILAITAAAAIAALAILFALLPGSEYFRVSAQTDDAGLPMLQSPDGALYRQNPRPGWQPYGAAQYLGVGGNYYLYRYLDDPDGIFLHGVEYVWAGSTVEYYRDGFAFPALSPGNVSYLTGVVYERSEYGEAMGVKDQYEARYSQPIRDPALTAQVFSLLRNGSPHTEIPPRDEWFGLGELIFHNSEYDVLVFRVPVIRVEDGAYFVGYETGADGAEDAYGVPVPDELWARLLEEPGEPSP